jgi:hypothetical protein
MNLKTGNALNNEELHSTVLSFSGLHAPLHFLITTNLAG